jgi:UDPglucose 6-dehydrogenase
VVARFGEDLSGRRFGLWGLAFKPNTDDMREAPSRVVVAELLARGATVCAYDPAAMHEARRVFGELPGLAYADGPMQAVQGADALVIVTEWKEFRSPDFEALKAALREPVIIDGRNLFAPELVRAAGLEYAPIGRAADQAGARADVGHRASPGAGGAATRREPFPVA